MESRLANYRRKPSMSAGPGRRRWSGEHWHSQCPELRSRSVIHLTLSANSTVGKATKMIRNHTRHPMQPMPPRFTMTVLSDRATGPRRSWLPRFRAALRDCSPPSGTRGSPQCGQALAWDDTWPLHSGQASSATPKLLRILGTAGSAERYLPQPRTATLYLRTPKMAQKPHPEPPARPSGCDRPRRPDPPATASPLDQPPLHPRGPRPPTAPPHPPRP